jgi:hypothetical protein
LVAYISAGFDPARFWKITPRLLMLEMQGAMRRREMRRVEMWEAEWLHRARFKGQPLELVSIKRFAPMTQRNKRQSREVLQAMCDALAHAWGAKMEPQ